MRTQKKSYVALVTASALFVAACGGDDDDTSAATAAPSTDAPAGPTTTGGDEDAPETTEAAPADDGGDAGDDLDRTSVASWDTAGTAAALAEIIGEYPSVEGASTRGIDGDTLKVAGVFPLTLGGSASYFDGICEGIETRLDRANANGELPYQIEFVECADTGGDPTTAAQATTKAVETDQVFALFGGTDDGAIADAAHVPYFAGYGSCGKTSPFGFDTMGPYFCAELAADGHQISTDGILHGFEQAAGLTREEVRYAGVTTNNSADSSILDGLIAQYEEQGVTVVGNFAEIPPESGMTVDLSPYVTDVVESGANVVGVVILDSQLQIRVIGAMLQAGYEGEILTNLPPDLMQNPSVASLIDGVMTLTTGSGFPVYESEHWDIINEDVASSGAAYSAQGFGRGWSNADLFVVGLQDFLATGAELTAEAFTNFLNDGYVYEGFGNVFAPQAFPFGHYSILPCTAVARLDAAAQGVVPVDNGDLSCGKVYVS